MGEDTRKSRINNKIARRLFALQFINRFHHCQVACLEQNMQAITNNNRNVLHRFTYVVL